jgi:hypothetical protein
VTLNQKIEANADLTLWCIHTLGPDQFLAAISHDSAVIRAREINQTIHRRIGDKHAAVLCFSYAAPWPWSKDDHADDMKKQASEKPV